MLALQPLDETPYGARLLPVETCGPNTRFEPFEPGGPQSLPVQQACLAEVAEGQRSVVPCGVLCEDSSQNHFQAGARRPPLLWSESLEESTIIADKHLARGSLRRVAYCRHTQKLYRACGKVNEHRDREIGRSGDGVNNLRFVISDL